MYPLATPRRQESSVFKHRGGDDASLPSSPASPHATAATVCLNHQTCACPLWSIKRRTPCPHLVVAAVSLQARQSPRPWAPSNRTRGIYAGPRRSDAAAFWLCDSKCCCLMSPVAPRDDPTAIPSGFPLLGSGVSTEALWYGTNTGFKRSAGYQERTFNASRENEGLKTRRRLCLQLLYSNTVTIAHQS